MYALGLSARRSHRLAHRCFDGYPSLPVTSQHSRSPRIVELPRKGGRPFQRSLGSGVVSWTGVSRIVRA
jgi:hypothetical protein